MADAARPSPHAKIRRRNRMITSCLECRRRKLKCDKSHPCVNCKKAHRDCMFLAPALDSGSQLKLTEIKEKMGMLSGSGRENRIEVADDEENLEPTPTAMADILFDDDDPDNDSHDLGFIMGRTRLSDRIGGYFRPAMVQELSSLLRDIKHDENTSFPSAYQRPANFVGPDENFLPPSSDFFLSSGRQGMSLINFLPGRATTDRLLQQYFYAVHPICRIVHRPSFQALYRLFWDDVNQGIEPIPSLQAIIFSMLFAAAVSVNAGTCMDEYGTTRIELVKNLQQAAEMALARAKFLRSTRLQTLQAFVMYLMPMIRDQISRAHCALVASAIRLAETMGLHRDGAKFGLKPVDTHVRRLVWWALLYLDHRCTEARGPRLIVHEDDFDTRHPVNKNDENLNDLNTPVQPGVVDKWTDMTFIIMQYECLEVHRAIWFDRPRVDKHQKSLTEVMVAIENHRRRLYAKYIPLLAEGTPLQQLTKQILELNLNKWHVAVLHRFHHSVNAPMPERIRQIMLTTARSQLEAQIALCQIPALQPWAWYHGAWYGWQVAFLLIVDYYVFPDWDQPERTWKCLDYAFESPPQPMPNTTKARLILLEIWDRMRIYREDRRLHPPTDLLKNLSFSEQTKEKAARIFAMEMNRQNAAGNIETVYAQDYQNSQGNSMSPMATFTPASSAPTDTPSPETQLNFEASQRLAESMGPSFNTLDFGSAPTVASPSSTTDFEMPDIDWNEWDKLFPTGLDQMDPGLPAFNSFGWVVDPSGA